MFSMVTVASSTRIPTASASPPKVMMLMVSPSADRQVMDARIDSGIEIVMISVLRQLPKNSRIRRPVSAPAITAARITPEIAERTNTDWSLVDSILSALGSDARISGNFRYMLSMISIVEDLPVLSTLIKTDRRPSTLTMLVWGEYP